MQKYVDLQKKKKKEKKKNNQFKMFKKFSEIFQFLIKQEKEREK